MRPDELLEMKGVKATLLGRHLIKSKKKAGFVSIKVLLLLWVQK